MDTSKFQLVYVTKLEALPTFYEIKRILIIDIEGVMKIRQAYNTIDYYIGLMEMTKFYN